MIPHPPLVTDPFEKYGEASSDQQLVATSADHGANLFRWVVSAMGRERVRPRGRMRPIAVHERAVDVQENRVVPRAHQFAKSVVHRRADVQRLKKALA